MSKKLIGSWEGRGGGLCFASIWDEKEKREWAQEMNNRMSPLKTWTSSAITFPQRSDLRRNDGSLMKSMEHEMKGGGGTVVAARAACGFSLLRKVMRNAVRLRCGEWGTREAARQK
jgi:hypothetical protein